MLGELQPLVDNQRIVTAEGLPTQYFIRWAQQRQIDISGGITAAEAQQLIDDWAATRSILAGVALHGGGTLAADRTIDHDDSLATPGTYGTATKVARIVVDAQGHIQGVTEVAISGGGGGGLLTFYAYDNTTVALGSTPANMSSFLNVTIPADTVDRLFMVNGNIVWRRGAHDMRGAVKLDAATTALWVWPLDDDQQGVADVNGGDGKNMLVYAGIVVLVPGDGAAHTIDLCWAAAASLSGVTVNAMHMVVTQIA